MLKSKIILVASLNWGIGHASRCIPIIRYLIRQNCNIYLASSGKAAELLRTEFPELPLHITPSYNVKYPHNGNMMFSIIGQIPKIIKAIYQEHKWLKDFLKKHNVEAVISDSCYGMWNNKVPSVFITHQLNIQAPFASGIINSINSFFIKKYNEVWVPDDPDTINLSGTLSYFSKQVTNVKYIGILSRFAELQNQEKVLKYDVCAIISGPEPQRTIFESIVLNQLNNFPQLKCVIVRGIENKPLEVQNGNHVIFYSHLSVQPFLEILNSSKIVVCRSGYSTLMDLACTENKAVLVPTPGQTEQEYLAAFHKEKGHYFSMPQVEFNLADVLKYGEHYKGVKFKDSEQYKQVINEWLRSI
ncbi:MAG: glycosyltransferase [Bacteroidetes bacterium]|nr:glycosyltransferase [Bacteroidota bacterium]MBV6460274.1 hypothetical protein [Flavobacteriales bacterium]WKZ74642.1 MAG: glycosyltransferase [Vicingaceae bacterium]MCL4815860.1 glycosyltransferase [Flavobacteriales bacterium]NOG94949.1 glycosyltransferase [Bacteroidota bacterium]